MFKKFASVLLGLIARLRFRARGKIIDAPAPGSLLVCNHTSIWDFAFVSNALRGRTDLRFVATGVQFDKSRLKKWAFEHLGVIRKNQGTHDVSCVKEIIKAVRGGETVVLFAAGMTSFDGRPAWDALPGTGSLAKLLKCGVYAAVIEGGFISAPRYAGRTFRGRVDVTVKKVFSGDEAALLSADEAQERINAAIDFNDWSRQEKIRAAFRHMRRMTGVSRTLYLCPACGEKGKMLGLRGALRCSACGFTAVRDKYGFFSSDNPACPRRMDEWADIEINKLKDGLAGEGFALSAAVRRWEKPNEPGAEYRFTDAGTLTFTRDGLSFAGKTLNGFLTLNRFQFFIMDDRDALIINEAERSIKYRFDDPALMTEWFFAHRLITGGIHESHIQIR